MSDAAPHIRVEHLRMAWGSRVLMDDLNFTVDRGQIMAVLGGSGSGKSTLLRYLIGLQRPADGQVYIEGLGDPYRYRGSPRFGVLFQSGALFSSLTLAENLELPLRTWTRLRGATAARLIEARLELVGLGGFGRHLPGEISGGMKKRAGIARALMLDPELLFLDEPSAGLDPISAAELDDLLLSLSRDSGITIVLVTHELPSVFLVADSCIVLEREARGIVARGDPRRLRDECDLPFVRAFFSRSARTPQPRSTSS